MPTPLGHALAGLAVGGVSGRGGMKASHLAVLVFCATAPDLDLALRFVDGVSQHRGPSHSFAAAALVGIAGAILRRLGLDLPSAWAMAAAWGSHVVLDYLGLDTSPPTGEMALWPFSHEFFASPVPVFYDVWRSFSLAAIRHNMLAVLIELLILVPVALLCWRRGPDRKAGSR